MDQACGKLRLPCEIWVGKPSFHCTADSPSPTNTSTTISAPRLSACAPFAASCNSRRSDTAIAARNAFKVPTAFDAASTLPYTSFARTITRAVASTCSVSSRKPRVIAAIVGAPSRHARGNRFSSTRNANPAAPSNGACSRVGSGPSRSSRNSPSIGPGVVSNSCPLASRSTNAGTLRSCSATRGSNVSNPAAAPVLRHPCAQHGSPSPRTSPMTTRTTVSPSNPSEPSRTPRCKVDADIMHGAIASNTADDIPANRNATSAGSIKPRSRNVAISTRATSSASGSVSASSCTTGALRVCGAGAFGTEDDAHAALAAATASPTASPQTNRLTLLSNAPQHARSCTPGRR